MKLDKETNILIIGLGVMGGSYASALSRVGYKVDCITKEQSSIDYAKNRGMIRYGTTEVEPELVKNADLIIFAIYPSVFIDWVDSYAHLFKKGAWVTDVTGVKGSVVYEVEKRMPEGVEFISAHPMAGREQSGVEFSDPSVFKGANYIVTPTKKSTKGAIELCKKLGQVLGFARISELSPEDHDVMIGFLSQLTHCIAVTLMNCGSLEGLEKYTGDSFRDLTRIAKINDKMWSELFISNKDALIHQMDIFLKEFSDFRWLLANENREEMRAKMRASTERRKLFDKPKG